VVFIIYFKINGEMTIIYLSFLATCLLKLCSCLEWSDLKLPSNHISIYFNNNPSLKQKCKESQSCPYKNYLDDGTSCWGYENGCSKGNAYSNFSCPGHHKGWVESKEEQLSTFYKQGDFGFVEEHRHHLRPYCIKSQDVSCKPFQIDIGDSTLHCSEHVQFCHGRNIMIDFRDLKSRKEPVRYHTDVLKPGQIGGKCGLNKGLLNKNLDLISALQSWGPELRNIVALNESVHRGSNLCDVWVSKPAIVTKLDASVSMYHHFCDFLNLYISQHVNNSDEYAFTTDTQASRRVCFENVVFPLLPRMIFGLYYNTPIIWGCENSGLFHAFSHYMLHRIGIPEREETEKKLHVTFLSRQTKYRRILNEETLLNALRKDGRFIVRKWTDILIGIHGSGLTHLLFLPDWAVIIELYDCGDPNCYQDLARLRGVKYLSWLEEDKIFPEDQGHHPDLGAHEKFTNYSFDKDAFVRLVRKAANLVKQHSEWKKLLKRTPKDEL
ncbi:EGF domain-specific O-linked N-acetylglucosamine transferase, partial [Armadillidium nasatum]